MPPSCGHGYVRRLSGSSPPVTPDLVAVVHGRHARQRVLHERREPQPRACRRRVPAAFAAGSFSAPGGQRPQRAGRVVRVDQVHQVAVRRRARSPPAGTIETREELRRREHAARVAEPLPVERVRRQEAEDRVAVAVVHRRVRAVAVRGTTASSSPSATARRRSARSGRSSSRRWRKRCPVVGRERAVAHHVEPPAVRRRCFSHVARDAVLRADEVVEDGRVRLVRAPGSSRSRTSPRSRSDARTARASFVNVNQRAVRGRDRLARAHAGVVVVAVEERAIPTTGG